MKDSISEYDPSCKEFTTSFTEYTAYQCRLCNDNCINHVSVPAVQYGECKHCFVRPDLDRAGGPEHGIEDLEIEDSDPPTVHLPYNDGRRNKHDGAARTPVSERADASENTAFLGAATDSRKAELLEEWPRSPRPRPPQEAED